MGVGCGRTGVSSSGQKLGDGDGGVEEDGGYGSELAQARAATAQYHRVEVAKQDGFVQASDCVASPAGVMGIHYLNLARMDGSLDITKPQGLLYLPKENQDLQLVGIEYIVPIFHNGAPYLDSAPPDPADVPATPMLFGQSFQGPMAGHGPGEPWHFDLHVWIWRDNPSGMFAQFNPALSCTASGDQQGDEQEDDGGISNDENGEDGEHDAGAHHEGH